MYEDWFGDEILTAVKAMTRGSDEKYFDYVRRVRENPIARAVKEKDLENNSDISRIPNPTEKDYARLKKYKQALDIIRE